MQRSRTFRLHDGRTERAQETLESDDNENIREFLKKLPEGNPTVDCNRKMPSQAAQFIGSEVSSVPCPLNRHVSFVFGLTFESCFLLTYSLSLIET